MLFDEMRARQQQIKEQNTKLKTPAETSNVVIGESSNPEVKQVNNSRIQYQSKNIHTFSEDQQSILRDDGHSSNEFVERQGFIEILMTLYFGPKEERVRLIFSM